MQTAKELLKRYERADMRTRLSMYLMYRYLRDDFLLIDMEEETEAERYTAKSREKHSKSQKGPQRAPWRKLLGHAFSCR